MNTVLQTVDVLNYREFAMTEKEFRKLKRQELLQLLLTQIQGEKELRIQFEETEARLKEVEEVCERLKARLNSKDAQIHKLAGRLNKKDQQIKNLKSDLESLRTDRKIKLREAGSIAEASLRLSGIYEAAQKAADLYLENVERMYGGQKASFAVRKSGEKQSSERSMDGSRE